MLVNIFARIIAYAFNCGVSQLALADCRGLRVIRSQASQHMTLPANVTQLQDERINLLLLFVST